MAGPFFDLPVVCVVCTFQDLLRLLIDNADRHEVLEMVEPRLARPGPLVHGLPRSPRNIRELVQLRQEIIGHRRVALLCCPPR